MSFFLPLTDPVYIFSLLLLLIFIAPQLATWFRLPSLVVLILLGALLGSHGLGILTRDAQLILLERVGLLYIMLLAGIQMDLSNFKQISLRSSIFGCLTFGVPFSIGLLSGYSLTQQWLVALLFGILYSPHTLMAYPIVLSLGIAQTEAIAVAVGGTVITTILTLSTYAILQALHAGQIGILLWIKLLIVLPLVIAASVWLLPKIGQRVAQIFDEQIAQVLIFIWTAVFVVASLTHLLGVDAIVGAFIAGLSLNQMVTQHSVLMRQIEIVGHCLFIPIFAISIGVLCHPTILLQHPENLGIAGFILLGAIAAKFIAAWLTGQWFQYNRSKILVLLGLTLSRSALVLVIALFGKNSGLLQEGTFNAVLLYVMVTCLAGPIVTTIGGKAIEPPANYRALDFPPEP